MEKSGSRSGRLQMEIENMHAKNIIVTITTGDGFGSTTLSAFSNLEGPIQAAMNSSMQRHKADKGGW